MKTTNQIIPAYATHPGAMLLDEIEANDYIQTDFAKLIGLKKSQLNEIIKGKRDINAELALLFQQALGIDADFWMEAQKNYDLDKAKIEAKNKFRLESIEIWNLIKALIPVSFFKKEGIISGDPCMDIPVIKSIYQTNDIENLATLSVQPNFARFKKSTKLKADVVNIMGWVKLVQFKASDLTVPSFHFDNKVVVMAELRKIILENDNVLGKAQNLLHQHGIKLVYQSKAEKTPVDGISFWSNGNPAIGMTLRLKKLDNFAFTLFHELGHIYEHLVNNNQAEFIDLDVRNEEEAYRNSSEEREANNFAQNHLISPEDWSNFKKNNRHINEDEVMVSFANQIKIHPSIVRGRVCFELNDYRSFSNIDHTIK